jgi:hypothetical protein
MPTYEFHSLFQKPNNEKCLIFCDVMYLKNKIQMIEFTCSILEVLA